MAIGAGSQVELAYVRESTRGTTPTTPTLKEWRATTRQINPQRTVIKSQEKRRHKQQVDVRHGAESVIGNVGYEMSTDSHNDWFEILFGNTFAALGASTIPISTTATNTISRASGSFVSDGFRPGDVVGLTGMSTATNNGFWRVVTVSASSLTVDTTNSVLATESAGAGKNLYAGKRLDVGTSLLTATVERQFLDLAKYQAFTGVTVGQWNLSLQPDQPAGGTFNLVGMKSLPISNTSIAGSAPSAPPSTGMMVAFDGEISVGGASAGIITSLELQVQTQRQGGGRIGSRYTPDIFEGEFMVTGTMQAYFQDATLYNLFQNETESAIGVRLSDPDGINFINIVIPRILYTGADLNPPPVGGITLPMPFEAKYHNTYLTSMWMQRSTTT